MANFKYDNHEDKKRLKDRALALKPRPATNVIATDMGWSHARPNGTMELLVSFKGLDALLGDVEPEVIDPNPVEVNVSIPVEASDAETEAKESDSAPVVKKAGRPKKVTE